MRICRLKNIYVREYHHCYIMVNPSMLILLQQHKYGMTRLAAFTLV